MNDSIEDMIDLVDPIMGMIDDEIDKLEDAEVEIEACINESDMFLVDIDADRIIDEIPGYTFGSLCEDDDTNDKDSGEEFVY